MKIVLGLLLISVASTLDHHDTHSWKRRDDFTIAAASRSIAPIKIKEFRSPQRSSAQSTHRSRSSSSTLKDGVFQTSPRRFTTVVEDSNEQQDFWDVTSRTWQDLTRENRAIESSLKNVIGRPSAGKVEQYQYISNFPYSGDESMADAVLENADDRPKNTAFSKDTQDHFLDHNAKEMEWSGQDVFEKDLQNEEDEEDVNIEEFLDEVRRKRLNGEFDEEVGAHRQGRRRKLTSQQQGVLLVETLRKKRNYTNDHRGHSSNLQSGLMDMLGRSMSIIIKKWNKNLLETHFVNTSVCDSKLVDNKFAYVKYIYPIEASKLQYYVRDNERTIKKHRQASLILIFLCFT